MPKELMAQDGAGFEEKSMNRLLWTLLALAACTGPAFSESPEDMAEMARTGGQAGLKSLWGLLLLSDEPCCESDSLKSVVKRGAVGHEAATVAVLEVRDGVRCDVLFLGTTGLGWRCLRHEVETSEIDSSSVLDS